MNIWLIEKAQNDSVGNFVYPFFFFFKGLFFYKIIPPDKSSIAEVVLDIDLQ